MDTINNLMIGFAFLAAATITAIMIGSVPDWWPAFRDWLFSGIKNLFSPNFGLGPRNSSGYTHREKHYGTNTNINFNLPKRPHIHQWAFSKAAKHHWYVFGGRVAGRSRDIDEVIKCLVEKPGHSETKIETVKSWKTSGAEIVHTSWNHWRCSVCSAVQATEFYTAPAKKDGTPIFNIDLNKYNDTDVSKKTTTTIPVILNKREVPVEVMKKYK